MALHAFESIFNILISACFTGIIEDQPSASRSNGLAPLNRHNPINRRTPGPSRPLDEEQLMRPPSRNSSISDSESSSSSTSSTPSLQDSRSFNLQKHETSTSTLTFLANVSNLIELKALLRIYKIKNPDFGVGSSFSIFDETIPIMPKFGNPNITDGCRISLLFQFSNPLGPLKRMWHNLLLNMIDPPNPLRTTFHYIKGVKIYKWPDNSHTLSIWLDSEVLDVPRIRRRIIGLLEYNAGRFELTVDEDSEWLRDWEGMKPQDMAEMPPV